MYCYHLSQRFEHTVRRHAAHTALLTEYGETLTYSALNQLAEQCASTLCQLGLSPRCPVALTGEKRALTYALMLACLKVGTPYVVLDPESPMERLRRILGKAEPGIIFAEGELADTLAADTAILAPVIHKDDEEFPGNTDARRNPVRIPAAAAITGESPAYIMFTSGSTGFPKGAVMTHQNVLQLIRWSEEQFAFGPGEILTNVNPLYFDNAVFDFYSALFTGAGLAAFEKQTVQDVGKLLSLIDQWGCTSWFSVPSLLMYLENLRALRPDKFRSVRRFIFGGEGYPKARLKRLFDTYGGSARLFNVYGPTECTCICSCHEITSDDFLDIRGFPPLGRLIPNFDYLIVDDHLLPVAADQTGELCLLGPAVGKGYYNDPERTAAAFIANPTRSAYTEIMYRTGDLVRLSSTDQNIWILGRRDHQVKHMGYRIELEEIENALCSLPGVNQAGVVQGIIDDKSRVEAAVSGIGPLESPTLRQQLSHILPTYMIPAAIHICPELPKNANGKIDRHALKSQLLGT